MTNRVAIVTDTTTHLGPDLARELARRGHDLVVGDPGAGLVSELEALGSTVESVSGVSDLTDPRSIETLMTQAVGRFGRVDSACIRTGSITTGSVFDATVEDLRQQVAVNIESVLYTLQTVLPPNSRRTIRWLATLDSNRE